MSGERTKLVMFSVVVRVPEDFFEETHIYGMDTRAGWVDDIVTYSGMTVPRDPDCECGAAREVA